MIKRTILKGLVLLTGLFSSLYSQIPYSIEEDPYTQDSIVVPHSFMKVISQNDTFDFTADIGITKSLYLVYGIIIHINGKDTVHGLDQVAITLTSGEQFNFISQEQFIKHNGYYYFPINQEFVNRTKKKKIKSIEIKNGYLKKSYISTKISNPDYLIQLYKTVLKK